MKSQKLSWAVAAAGMWALLCGVINASAASVVDLTPDQLFVVDALRQRLADLDAWRCQTFKQEAWTDLSNWIAQYLAARNEAEFRDRIEQLKRPETRSFVPAAMRGPVE